MVPSHHVGIFLPKTKGFFPHDFTLIASVVGESVIGHGIGGKYIPIMARLAKARRWSKRWQTCLSSPDLTAIHNEWWLEDPSTFTPRTTERSYDILRRESLRISVMNLGRVRAAGILKRISYEIQVSYACK